MKRAEDVCGVPRRLHRALRQAGGLTQHPVGPEPRGRAQGVPRRTSPRRARGAGRDQPLQDRIGLRRGGRDRDDAPSARNAARGDELGHGAVATAFQEVAVPPLRRSYEQESWRRAETAGSRERRRSDCSTRALQKMNSPEHQFAGPLLHDRIIGAMELCCRRGEMLLIQNRRVNWETCQIGIPGATAKDRENRRVPFNPEGRLAAVLKRRSALGPDAFVFGAASGAYQPNIQTAWETLKLLAYGYEPKTGSRRRGMEPRAAPADRSPLARPATRGRMPAARRRRRYPHHPADARPREHSADAAVSERDRRGTQKRTGGELEQQRPTASTRIGRLKCSTATRKPSRPARLSPICHPRAWRRSKFGCGGGI